MPAPTIELATIYPDEAQLLAGLRRHDPDSCACLIKRFAPQLYRRTLRVLRDPDEAESALQSTFSNACAKLDDFAERGDLGAWLGRIATNEALMQLRRRREQISLDLFGDRLSPAETAALPPDPANLALAHELRAQLGHAIAALSDGLRQVFVLREIHGLSTEETAESLGLGTSAVKVRLHRARLQLRAALAEYVG